MKFGISVFFLFSGKFLGIDSALLPNCEWNQKPKHKKPHQITQNDNQHLGSIKFFLLNRLNLCELWFL